MDNGELIESLSDITRMPTFGFTEKLHFSRDGVRVRKNIFTVTSTGTLTY